ncbi:Proteolipid membrane potential modulator domain containing protein [Elaphomyces granulatus]
MASTSTASAVIIVIITLFLPPIGVFIISGCSVDFFINILLTILGYLPGHIHAFYLEYIYFERRRMGPHGRLVHKKAPGVYSDRIQGGGGKSL